MQYTKDPKSGNELSILGYGCMRLPSDFAKAEKLLVEAVEAGVNYFDTAYIYGNNEVTVGSILEKNGLREKIYLATKLPHQKCKDYESIEKLFSEQLDRLKTTYIDYYLIHNIPDMAAWKRLCDFGIEKWIEEKKSSGQIKQIGFSFHGTQKDFMELLDIYDWEFCLIQYNYMDENYQAGKAGLNKAYEKGMAVMIMEPLLGGKLATGLPTKAVQLFQKLDTNRSMASWALRWLWTQPGVSVVLSGMNKPEQLEDNVKTASIARDEMLSDIESNVYTPVIEALRESYKVPCTGCNYCMPCPVGVNIPGCFMAYNSSYVMGLVSGFTLYLTGTSAYRKESKARASCCIKCGACLDKCPQSIAIPDMLGAVAKKMEPLWVRAILSIARLFMR